MGTWADVATAIRARRLALKLTQQEAAQEAGVSLATWRQLESAGREKYQPLTLAGVAGALGWPPDAIERLLAGEPFDLVRPFDSDLDFNSRIANVSEDTRRAILLLIEAEEAKQRR